jgi:hypothetical protein
MVAYETVSDGARACCGWSSLLLEAGQLEVTARGCSLSKRYGRPCLFGFKPVPGPPEGALLFPNALAAIAAKQVDELCVIPGPGDRSRDLNKVVHTCRAARSSLDLR